MTLNVEIQGPGYFGGNGSSNATILETSIRPSGLGVRAGGFALKGNLDGVGPIENFTAWCLDIATYLNLSSTYTATATATPFASGALSFLQISNIEQLFETGLKNLTLGNNAQSTGFQLALWEVFYEQSGTFNLAVGNFRATNSTNAIAAAQALLLGMSGPLNQSYDLTFLQSNDPRNTHDGHFSQHLVTVTAVPLPAGGVLLLAGLGALPTLRRRATKAA